MSNPALQDLATRIAANQLTPSQKAALLEALDAIIPTFPTPDQQSNGIPPTEELLARMWIAALYAINAEGVSDLPLGTPATAWGQSSEDSTNGAAKVAVSATITPQVTGRLRVQLSGSVHSSTQVVDVVNVSQSISHGNGVTSPTDFDGSPVTIPANGADNLFTEAGFVVDMDRNVFDPIVFPVGTPVKINAVLSADHPISWNDGALQLAITERGPE